MKPHRPSRVDEMRAMREGAVRDAVAPKPPKRKTPLGRKPRSKGNRGERLLIDLFKQYGWPYARRNFQSGGQGGGDVLNGPEGFNHECKNQERLNIWAALAQSEAACRPSETALVWFRRNNSQWYVAMPAEYFLARLRELEDIDIALLKVDER